MQDKSIASFFENLFGSGVLSLELSEAEKLALYALQVTQAGVTGVITATPTIAADLETLLPTFQPDIANAAAKVEGAEAAVKAELGKVIAWLTARTVTTTSSADEAGDKPHFVIA